ncbi:DUF1654 domain-containing protein [Pseudomonas sp. GD03860]|uniref:DUF1654 domain-containing protein n=1 Tax=Pseudomonas sp. GD03860 TaxID=2975389 RepID=UPI00244BBA25|nr:DUF1654 domain-containing protein [Pseudomonas sp. GD03860]MDH0640189.1 DUF1654 domain-containing protein [Pseudomonas sp. GD03860]
MAKAKQQAQALTPPTSFDLLGMRVQKIINSTGAQASKRAVIYKAPEELQEDWEQLLEAIDEADNVTIAHRDDGGVLVSWVVPKED